MENKKPRLALASITLAGVLAACGTTIEIPSVSLQLPGAPPLLPRPALKLPDIKTQDLIAKLEGARRGGGLSALKAESATLKTMFASATANDFLAAVDSLPKITPRKIYGNEIEGRWMSQLDFEALPKSARGSGYAAIEYDEDRYFSAHYLSPLAYARGLDVANLHGLSTLAGARVLDMSFGAIAAPRLMAASGAEVVAFDSERALTALYSQIGDIGPIAGVSNRRGSLSVLTGTYASDAASRSQLGAGYDLILLVDLPKRTSASSKRAKLVLDSKASSAEQLRALAGALKPNGLMVIYRSSAGVASDSRRPVGPIKSPFTVEELQEAGLRVLAFEQNDDAAVRQMGQLLRWDRMLGVSEHEVFANYSVLRR
jgi:hypothetical protein